MPLQEAASLLQKSSAHSSGGSGMVSCQHLNLLCGLGTWHLRVFTLSLGAVAVLTLVQASGCWRSAHLPLNPKPCSKEGIIARGPEP